MPIERVVFDCNVYFQALISADGPSANCLIAAARGEVQLFCSEPTIVELRHVAGRSLLRRKFDLTDAKVENLIEAIRGIASFVDAIPELYRHPDDPDDSHYVNLAAACSAHLIVSRDHDLVRLMDQSRPEGRDFRSSFPTLEIIEPQTLLRRLRERPPSSQD